MQLCTPPPPLMKAVSQTKGNKDCCETIHCIRQHSQLCLRKGLRLIKMATLLMVALRPRSAGRHHRTKLWADGEGSEDWGWAKLSLKTVLCNVLWEPQSPHVARQGINQRDARRTENALFCHMYTPSISVIYWLLLSIDFSFLSVISHLRMHQQPQRRSLLWVGAGFLREAVEQFVVTPWTRVVFSDSWQFQEQ